MLDKYCILVVNQPVNVQILLAEDYIANILHLSNLAMYSYSINHRLRQLVPRIHNQLYY